MDLVDGTGLIIEQPSETESELGLLPCVKTLPLRLSPTSGSISLPSALLLIRGSNDLRTHLCEDVGNMSIRQGVSSAEDCFDITIGGRGAGAFGRSWEITVRGRLMDRFRCLACDLGEFPLLIDERFPPRAATSTSLTDGTSAGCFAAGACLEACVVTTEGAEVAARSISMRLASSACAIFRWRSASDIRFWSSCGISLGFRLATCSRCLDAALFWNGLKGSSFFFREPRRTTLFAERTLI